MKKILTILIILSSLEGFSQVLTPPNTPGVTSRSTVPIEDRYLFARQHLGIPRYTDTSQANTYGGLVDSCGALIYTYDVSAIWYRACNGYSNRVWIQILPAGGGTGAAGWTLGGNLLLPRPDSAVLGSYDNEDWYLIANNLKFLKFNKGGIQANTVDVVPLGVNMVTGDFSFASTSGSGANTALSNLASVAINTSLLPGTTNSIDLGSSSKTWRSLYFPNTLATSTDGVVFRGGNRFMHDFRPSGANGDNLFIGDLAGNFTMSGTGIQSSYNTGFGPAALNSLTIGYRNTAFGAYSQQSTTTGFSNTSFGQSTMQLNNTGFNNSAFGIRSLLYNTNGTSNSAFGVDALFANTSGVFNAGFSIDALYQNTTGSYNSAFGDSTFWIGTVGIKNTGIGSRAGYYLGDTYPNFASVKDSMVTFLGADASRDSSILNTTALKNLTVIGYNAKGYASNQVVLGNSDVTTTLLRGSVGIANTSPSALLTLGTAGTTLGNFSSAGNTSGVITFNPQAAAGTYNWNWPTTEGTSGYLLTSAGGGSSPMTWTNPATLGGSIAIGDAVTSATAGSIFFAGTGGILQQKNADFFYDSTNRRIGIGTSSPNVAIHAVENAINNVPPTLGTASGIMGLTANGNLYGTFFGTRHNTGEGWIQQMRRDGTVTAYGLFLQPSGGNVGIGIATAAGSRLDIVAGSATANTAPVQLHTGPFETVTRAGILQYSTPQLTFTNGGLVMQELFQGQQSRVSTQYDNTTTTLGNITGLTANVAAGKIYRFEAKLYTTSDVAGGIKVAIGGTCTATAIRYEGLTTDAGLTTQSRSAALATAVGAVTAVTAAYVVITGTITVNAAGTITVQAAANAATGTTSVLTGSTFVITEML